MNSTDVNRLAEAIEAHGKAVEAGCNCVANAISEGFHELSEALISWDAQSNENRTITDAILGLSGSVSRLPRGDDLLEIGVPIKEGAGRIASALSELAEAIRDAGDQP